MYIDWFDAFLNNLRAERLGIWKDYPDSLRGMVPFDAAANRRTYTKLVVWFLDDLEDLDEATNNILENGGFVVRRSVEPYGAVSPDLATEQTIMAQIKGRTGQTRGRAFTDLGHTIWVQNRPVIAKVDQQLKDMIGYSPNISQSSVKAIRPARVARDCQDVATVKSFLKQRLVFDPFVISTELRSISSGIVAPPKVNIHRAFDVGVELLKSLKEANPATVKIKKEQLCIQMPSNASVSIPETNIQIDSQLLLQRALAQVSNPDSLVSLAECLGYELSPVPQSMFTNVGLMRNNDKSELAKYLTGKYGCIREGFTTGGSIVIDGGALLHRIKWPKNASIDEIIELYISCVQSLIKQFDISPGAEKTVVFDGYTISSTKDHCHTKRQPVQGLRIDFAGGTRVMSSKSTFLSNRNNKQRLVDRLSSELRLRGVTVQNCAADADIKLASTVLQMEGDVILWGDDTDLLVLLLHHINVTEDKPRGRIVMYRPSSSTSIEVTELMPKIDASTIETILAIHAWSGCDTVSSLFSIGKTKLIKLMEKHGATLAPLLQVFYRPCVDESILMNATVSILAALYDKIPSKYKDLESLRLWLV